jgi:heme/copper-type cytochrome/quinol oxidase subunit 2
MYIPEFKINEDINPGQKTVINFIADKKGVFDFSCSVACGRGHGQMTGQIIVE